MLDKTYRPAEIEAKFDRRWQQGGHFAPVDDPDARPYCIVIPPPNVTGSLHMGHALNNTIQDCLIRFHRMLGRAALWQPGTDHAGIATQMVVERELAKEGITRRDLGRDAFVERVWAWKERSGGQISRQLHRLGASADGSGIFGVANGTVTRLTPTDARPWRFTPPTGAREVFPVGAGVADGAVAVPGAAGGSVLPESSRNGG